MKRTKFIFLLLFCLGLSISEAVTSSGRAQKAPVVSGNWVLKIVGQNDPGRTIIFTTKKGRLEGKYYPAQGPPVTISSAKLTGKLLQFSILQLKLYFEMWFTGDHFEGKMTTSSTTQKITAVPVTMSRK